MTLAPTRPIWLSGAIQTAIHRFALPAILLGMVASFLVLVVRGVLPTEGIVATSSVGLFPLVVSAAVLWLPSHLYSVGHCGSELVIGNYRRKVSVPFDQIAAVEAVGAVKNLVRIRFHHATPFGAT